MVESERDGRKEEEKPGPREDNLLSLLDHGSDLPGIARAAKGVLGTLVALCAPAHEEDSSSTFSTLNWAAGTSAISKCALPIITQILHR